MEEQRQFLEWRVKLARQMIGRISPLEFLKNWCAPATGTNRNTTRCLDRLRAVAQMNNEEYRRNQHSVAASGISGVLDTGHAGTGQPQEIQHSGRKRSGTD